MNVLTSADIELQLSSKSSCQFTMALKLIYRDVYEYTKYWMQWIFDFILKNSSFGEGITQNLQAISP